LFRVDNIELKQNIAKFYEYFRLIICCIKKDQSAFSEVIEERPHEQPRARLMRQNEMDTIIYHCKS